MKIMMLLKISFLLLTLPAITIAQWVNTASPHFSEVAVSGINIFAVEQFNGVYLSTNNGNNWTQTSLNIPGLVKITAEGTNIFAGTEKQESRGIYRSTNSGLNWSHVLSSVELYSITCITINGNNIYASTGRTFYRSTDNGTTWTNTQTTFFTYSIALSGNFIFAGVEASGVYLSTNIGLNWVQTSLGNRNVLSVKINGSNIFAGTDAGVYLSTNNGTSWTQTTLNNRYVSSLAVINGNIFAGTDEGVYISTNNGSTWIQKNQGLGTDISDGPHLAVSAEYIFASNPSSSTYRRNLSEIISVRQISTILPEKFSLGQNYPNPFNPITKIIFSLPQNSFASLKIFNQLGIEIANPVNQKMSAGTYEYIFDASSLSSGVYYYRLETEFGSQTKSMVLVK